MKKVLLNFAFLLSLFTLKAQAPQAVCYQAVATDAEGKELVDNSLGVRISIIKGSAVGTPIYVETHNKKTDDFGLFTLDIGTGSLISATPFNKIDWGTDKYFIKTEIDPAGGSNYTTMGTSQLISVPYALYANRAGSAVKADTASYTKYAEVAKVAETSSNDKDTDPTNELQKISFTNGVLTISPAPAGGGGAVQIQDADGDPKNEIQELKFNGQSGDLSITNGSSGTTGTTVNIYSGLFKFPASSLEYPLGVLGSYRNIGEGNYTVPAGKILFLTAGPESFRLVGFGSGEVSHRRLPGFPVFKSGTTVKDCKCTGLLVNNSDIISAEAIDLQTSPVYQVPAGKDLIIKSGLATDGYLIINDILYQFLESPSLAGNIILPEGTLIKKLPGALQQIVLTGYLIPHNKD